MPITNIATAKELSQSYTPLLLAEITLSDGTPIYLSSHDFQSTTTVQYNSHNYEPRILNQDIAATAALSDLGIDAPPLVTLKLADSDRELWDTYEIHGPGFKGADVVLRFVFCDLATLTFSSDSFVAFIGIADPPSLDDDSLTLRAVSKLNMSRINMPLVRVSKRHPYPFPSTPEERKAALYDPTSPFYRTGYCPYGTESTLTLTGGMGNLKPDGSFYTSDDFDGTFESYIKVMGKGTGTDATATCTVSGGHITSFTVTNPGSGYTSNPIAYIFGNGQGGAAVCTSSGGMLTSVIISSAGANYTIAPQVIITAADGDLTHDHLNRPTGTFGGIRFVAPNVYAGSDYLAGKNVVGASTQNTNLYNDFFPMIYGTGLVNPVVCNILGEPNSTRGEAVLCLGKIGGIVNNQITVNDTLVPAATDIDGIAITPKDNLLRYNVINRGNRNGGVNLDNLFNGKGDCYGSLACIEWCVEKAIAASTSVPNISAIVQGTQVAVFASTTLTDFTYQYSENPAWILLDLLIQAGWTYDLIDIQSFIDSAAVCNRTVHYIRSDGNAAVHPIFQTSLVMRQRKSAAQWIRGLRTSFRSTLIPCNNGLLKLRVDQTLAEQQPSPITGSNYNTAIPSMSHDGTTTNGYAAYRFSDEPGSNTILRNGKKSTLTIEQSSVANSCNAVNFQFMDSENGYQTDTITTMDSNDINRTGQTISTSLTVDGINSFDQGQRIAAWWLAKTNHGNPRNDSSGTWTFKWQTSFRALHLNVGDIVLLKSVHDGITGTNLDTDLDGVLVRISKIQPATNFETISLEGTWHEDIWHIDAWGTSGYMSISNPAKDPKKRLAHPWLPNQITTLNLTHDPLYSDSTYSFDFAQDYPIDTSGKMTPVIYITGNLPINNLSPVAHPPVIPLTTSLSDPMVSTASTGGTIPGNRLVWFSVSGVDVNGLYSAPSAPVSCIIPAGTNTNIVAIHNILWRNDSAIVGYAVFGGLDSRSLCYQASDTGRPTSITISTWNDQTWGQPDIECRKVKAKIKHAYHTGVIGFSLTAVTSTSVSVLGEEWDVNEWAGRIISITGDLDNQNQCPIWNFKCVSNTADTIILDSNPLTTPTAVAIGDVMIIRTLADSFSATTIGDSKFSNFEYPTGMLANGEVGRTVRIIFGKGQGQTATIVSNTSGTDTPANVVTIDGQFNPIPDATSVFIIEDSTWLTEITSDPFSNSKPNVPIKLTARIDNFLYNELLIQLVSLNADGKESSTNISPYRELWTFGAQGSRTITTNATMRLTDSLVNADATAGPIVFTCLPFIQLPNVFYNVVKSDTSANSVTIQTASSDDTFDDGSTSHVLYNPGDTCSFRVHGPNI